MSFILSESVLLRRDLPKYILSILIKKMGPYHISYNPGQNISGKLQFFCEIAPYGKSSISICQEFLASTDKILILGARLSTGL